ncbi:hypothetical protein AGMMS49975_19100 [Clostridia bacterium]|nr:hypothetical protein AGMMS49975_19100 [Clostridia bacterium]
MRQRISLFYNNTRDKWAELDRTRKIKLAITIATVIITIIAIIFFATRSKMVVLYDHLSYAEGGAYQMTLTEGGIRNSLSQGVLKVREKDADRAYYELSVNGPLNTATGGGETDSSFVNAINLMTLGTTESTKRAILQNQYEQHLASNLRMFNGVSAARVTFSVPDQDRYFIRENQRSTASVVLTTTKEFSKKEMQTMARYICGVVKGLTMEDIEITNQDALALYSGQQPEDDLQDSYAVERARADELETKVKSLVAPIYDEANIVSNLHVNNDKQKSEMRTYENPNENEGQVGFPTQSISSKSSASGATDEGDVGLDANDNAAATYEMGGNNGYSAKKSDSQTDYVYNEQYTATEKSTGWVDYDNSSLALVLYRYNVFDQADFESGLYAGDIEPGRNAKETALAWRQFKEANKNFTQVDPQNTELQGLRLTVATGTHIPLDNVSILAYDKPVFIEKTEVSQVQHYAILVILGLLILLLLYGFIKKTQPEEITDIEQPLEIETLLASSAAEAEKEAEEEEAAASGSIEINKENEFKLQIEKFIEERPEAVAQLLRNWLNEDWE